MIYFLTVHYKDDVWIDVQLRHIARNTPAPYEIWAVLDGISEEHHSKFHRVFDYEAEHPDRLNYMAKQLAASASPDDIIVFIDGDAFPVTDWVTPVTGLLERYPLVAPRRSEILGDPFPHPCFAVTTVGWWDSLPGDWRIGGELEDGTAPVVWINTVGRKRTGVGAQLMARLDELAIPWHALRRTNRFNFHPIHYAVYGDLVYHHGAGFRNPQTMVDAWQVGVYRYRTGLISLLALVRLRLRRYRNARLQRWVLDQILADDDWVAEALLRERGPTEPTEPIGRVARLLSRVRMPKALQR